MTTHKTTVEDASNYQIKAAEKHGVVFTLENNGLYRWSRDARNGGGLHGSGFESVIKAAENACDKLNGEMQARGQYESIREMVAALNKAEEECGAGTTGYEEAETAIQEVALSVEVRSGWYSLGQRDADTAPAEFRILLCTGGPATQIVGDISEHGEPEKATMQFQDWFTPWTEWLGQGTDDDRQQIEENLLAYARCFYFGEG